MAVDWKIGEGLVKFSQLKQKKDVGNGSLTEVVYDSCGEHKISLLKCHWWRHLNPGCGSGAALWSPSSKHWFGHFRLKTKLGWKLNVLDVHHCFNKVPKNSQVLLQELCDLRINKSMLAKQQKLVCGLRRDCVTRMWSSRSLWQLLPVEWRLKNIWAPIGRQHQLTWSELSKPAEWSKTMCESKCSEPAESCQSRRAGFKQRVRLALVLKCCSSASLVSKCSDVFSWLIFFMTDLPKSI